MFEKAVDLMAEVVGCDGGRGDGLCSGAAAAGLPSACLSDRQLIDRIAATERLVNELLAEQARDLAAFLDARLAADQAAGVEGGLQGRTISTEVGLALGVAPLTAGSRVATAAAVVERHPRLLELCGSGRVSMARLRKAAKATGVLDPERCRAVDVQLAADATNDRLTPGMLERAATRRVIAADPDAAAKRRRRPARRSGSGCATPWTGPPRWWRPCPPSTPSPCSPAWIPGRGGCAPRATNDPCRT